MNTKKVLLLILSLLSIVLLGGILIYYFFNSSNTTTQESKSLEENSQTNQREIEVYTVQEGESLLSIASRYKISTETLMRVNSLNSDFLEKGVVLRIPPVDGTLVIVEQGDTISSIAQKYSSDEQLIVDYNWLEYPFTLEVGSELFIPDSNVVE